MFNKSKKTTNMAAPVVKPHSLSGFLEPDSIKKPPPKKRRLNKQNAGNPWMFNGEALTEPPSGFYGFVYCLTNTETNQKYIGKKFFVSVSGKGKKAVKKESNWRSYWSSSKNVKTDIDALGKDKFHREILVMCREKRDVDLQEVQLLWTLNVLGSTLDNDLPMYYNDNISGRYYRRTELFEPDARMYSNTL